MTSTRCPFSFDAVVDVVPIRASAEEVDSAELRVAVHLQRDVGRDDELEPADVDASVDMRLADRQLHVAEVDAQVADAEPVVVPQLLETRDRVLPVADAAPDVDVDDGGEDRGRDEHERDERGDREQRAT